MAAILSGLGGLPANQSHFELEVQGLAPGTLTVASFDGGDHALSRDYRFRVEVIASHRFELAPLLGVPAVLSMVWAGDRTRVHGVVTHISQAGDTPQGARYVIVLGSPLAPLTQTRRNRVFLNRSVLEIVTEVLRADGFAADAFSIQATGQYAAREFVAQYDESDYDFLTRQLAYHGLYFTFRQDAQRAVLLIHDDLERLSESLGAVPLPYQVQTGEVRSSETVFALRRRLELTTGSVFLKDYNDQAPERPLTVESRGGVGEDYRYGEHYGDDAEGARLARLRREAFDGARDTVVADTDCRGLRVGGRLTLSRHPDPSLNGDWVVLEIEHQGDQSAGLAFGPGGKGLTYVGKLLMIRVGRPYRLPYAPRRVYGAFTAKIEGDGGQYAFIDDHGRYRLRLPWDLSEAPSGQASHPVRLMQPYGGRDHGLHFPLHAGAEVAVSFVNGDIDRPIILGVLSNTATPSPVTAANPSQNILRTWGGNELLMEDRQGEERIELFTRERRNILSLDARQDAHQVRLATEEGDMEVFAGKSMLIEVGESQTTQVGADHTVTVAQAQRLMTQEAEIEYQAATDFLVKAGQNVRVTAEAADIELTAGRDAIVQTGGDLSVEVRSGDASVLVSQGGFALQARGAITVKGEGQGKISIGQGGGTIEISESGDLTVNAPSVEINAGTIAINGQTVSNN